MTVTGTVMSTVPTPSLTVTTIEVLPAATPVRVTVPLSRLAAAVAASGPVAMAVMVSGSLSASSAMSVALKVVVLPAVTLWGGTGFFGAGGLFEGGSASVAGNTAVTTPESAALLTDVAPATVKKFAATPAKVYPDFGVKVMVAV